MRFLLTSIVGHMLNGSNAGFDVSRLHCFYILVLFAAPVFVSKRLMYEINSSQKATDQAPKYYRGLNMKCIT
jgi:hypothetical protein